MRRRWELSCRRFFMKTLSSIALAARLDAAFWKPVASPKEFAAFCAEARAKKIRAVTVNGARVALASAGLEDGESGPGPAGRERSSPLPRAPLPRFALRMMAAALAPPAVPDELDARVRDAGVEGREEERLPPPDDGHEGRRGAGGGAEHAVYPSGTGGRRGPKELALAPGRRAGAQATLGTSGTSRPRAAERSARERISWTSRPSSGVQRPSAGRSSRTHERKYVGPSR